MLSKFSDWLFRCKIDKILIADIIIPSPAFTEQNGLFINLEGRLQQCIKATYPPGDSLEDWKIFNLLNKRVKNKELFKNYKELLEDTTNKIKNNKNFDSLPIIETKNIKFKEVSRKINKLRLNNNLIDFIIKTKKDNPKPS